MKKWFSILFFCLYASSLFAQDTDNLAIPDSTSWRKDADFAYMTTLDSLLRVANHRTDSINAHRRVVISPNTAASNGFASFFQNTIVQIFFWSMLLLFIAYIIYALFFRYPAGKALKEEDETEILENGDLLDEDFYKQKIATAEQEGNYRLAVRFHFLLTLAQLNALEKIHFTPEKTNADYIRELKEDYRAEEFARLSNIFTYVWYGKQEINGEDYADIKELFTETSFSVH